MKLFESKDTKQIEDLDTKDIKKEVELTTSFFVDTSSNLLFPSTTIRLYQFCSTCETERNHFLSTNLAICCICHHGYYIK